MRVDPDNRRGRASSRCRASRAGANLNTAVFDRAGILWFTGQNGVYGRLDPATGEIEVFDAPRGRGPYGITTTPDGDVWYASLAGNHIARIDPRDRRGHADRAADGRTRARAASGPTREGRIWVSEWNAGQVGRYDPATGDWREWQLPGQRARMAYAVYVDDRDIVWLTDFGANAIVRFDPATETFTPLTLPTAMPPSASCSAGRARCGARNRGSTASSSSIRLRKRPATARGGPDDAQGVRRRP